MFGWVVSRGTLMTSGWRLASCGNTQVRHKTSILEGVCMGFKVNKGNPEVANVRISRVLKECGDYKRLRHRKRHETPSVKKYRLSKEKTHKIEQKKLKEMIQEAMLMKKMGF